jgi:hypothetical protein
MNHHHDIMALAEHHRSDLLADADRARRSRQGRHKGGHPVRSFLRRNRQA